MNKMDKDFSACLLGSRSAALEAAVEFQTKMQLTAANGNRNQFKFGLLLLRSLCVALQSSKVQHFDIICDIAEKTVFPHVKPSDKSLNYWDTFLSVLRYFLHTLGTKNIKKHNAMYAVLKKMHYTLKAEGDYKYFLDIHMQHLNLQQHQQPHTIEVSDEIESALESLSELFENMFNLMKSDGFCYPELLNELNKLMLAKRSAPYLKFLSSLPTEASNKMFNSLFKLISALPAVELAKQTRDHLGMFLALLQIDINDAKLQQQLALQHMRCCRDLFKADPIIGHFFQLLYYYIKLAYSRIKVPEFRQTYWGLCKKFTNLFESKSETHMKDQWFLDSLVVIQRMQILLHFNINNGPFDVFWEQMNGDIELYTGHFNLISCCVKLSANISGSELGLPCSSGECTSIRKHVILSFGTSALATYSVFMQQQNQMTKSEKDMTELSKSFLSIIRYTISVICTMPCMSSTSSELIYIIQRFIKMGQQITKPSFHVTLYLQLVQYLPKIRDKIAALDWQKIMRYVYKTSALSDQLQLSVSMHCLYISTLVDHSNLRNQITFFYQCTKNSEKCITQILDECQSPLKSELSDNQKRHIYVEEMSFVQIYLKHNIPLMKSLLRYSHEAHDYAILARYLKSDKEVTEKQRKTYLFYRQKSQTAGQLSRLDHLVFAYVCAAQLNYLTEQQKHQIDIKTVTESCLEEYLCNRDLTKIDGETKRLNVAIEALHAFEEFYDKADLEPIDADSQIYIDWESIMDDIANVAHALQLMGYMSEATDAWLLLHRITCTLDDRFNYLRSVTFFFAHSDLFESEKRINLQFELIRSQQIIVDVLPQLKSVNLFKRYQTITLLCLCQMANYYGRIGCLQYAYVLLVKVSKIRDEFEERRGKVDIIYLTMQIVRYRLIWHHKSSRKSNVLVLRVMDMILDSFRIFTSFSSVDNTFCMLLSMGFVQNCIECSANRFGERISLVFTVLNMSLQSGLSLRAIQLFTFLLWSNLQMEYVDKAQSMLRIIEHIFCGNSSGKSGDGGGGNNSSIPSTKPVKPIANCHEQINNQQLTIQMNSAFVEPIRRQNVMQLSDELEKLDLSDKAQTVQLESFQYAEEKSKYLQGNKQLQWTYFIVGCFKARLHFLAKDFGQLDDFYEHTENWLNKRASHKFLSNYYKNMQLVNTEFYVNYLRSVNVFDKATTYLKKVLDNARNFQHVDVNYRYNLSLQLKTLGQEQEKKSQVKPSNLRRALILSRFPQKPLGVTPSKSQIAIRSNQSKTDHLKGKPNNNKTTSFETFTTSPSSSSSSGSDDVDLNACQVIEIIDLDDTVESVEANRPKGKTLQESETQRNVTSRFRKPLGGTDSNKHNKNGNSEEISQLKITTRSKNPRAAPNTKSSLKKVAANTPPKILTPNIQMLKVTASTQRSGRSNLTSTKSMENFVAENASARKTRAQLRRIASQHKENMAQ